VIAFEGSEHHSIYCNPSIARSARPTLCYAQCECSANWADEAGVIDEFVRPNTRKFVCASTGRGSGAPRGSARDSSRVLENFA